MYCLLIWFLKIFMNDYSLFSQGQGTLPRINHLKQLMIAANILGAFPGIDAYLASKISLTIGHFDL